MNERETADRLNQLADEMAVNSCDFWGAPGRLGHSADQVLAIPEPPGKPHMIEETATAARNAAAALAKAKDVVAELRQQKLPAAWSGSAQVAASDALAVLEGALERASQVYDTAKDVHTHHAREMSSAQFADNWPRHLVDVLKHGYLEEISHRYNPFHEPDVWALRGVRDGFISYIRYEARDWSGRKFAWVRARDAAERAASDLDHLTSQARAHSSSALDPMSQLWESRPQPPAKRHQFFE